LSGEREKILPRIWRILPKIKSFVTSCKKEGNLGKCCHLRACSLDEKWRKTAGDFFCKKEMVVQTW